MRETALYHWLFQSDYTILPLQISSLIQSYVHTKKFMLKVTDSSRKERMSDNLDFYQLSAMKHDILCHCDIIEYTIESLDTTLFTYYEKK